MFHVIAIVCYYTQWRRGGRGGGGGDDAGIQTKYTYLKSPTPLLPVGAVQLTDRLDRVFMRL